MNQCDLDLEVCPYDPAHMILKSRMLTHLAKCSKNFPLSEKGPCIFNKKHIIPLIEMKYHEHNCPDRIKVDSYVNKVGDLECPVENEAPISIDMPPTEENWDDEPVAESVLHKIRDDITEKNIIVTASVIGKTKRQRRDFRESEIRRHTALETTSKPPSKPQKPLPSTTQRKEDDMKPLRLPVGNSTSLTVLNKLKKQDEERSSGSSAKLKTEPMPCTSSDGRLDTISDGLMKNVKISNSSAASDSLRMPEPTTQSYAMRLAKCDQAAAAKKQKAKGNTSSLNAKNSNNNENMQVLTSSIFENGPRGRGRLPSVTSPPASVNTPKSPPSSVRTQSSTPASMSSATTDFLTDEHGFLLMPVPGKGRGRGLLT